MSMLSRTYSEITASVIEIKILIEKCMYCILSGPDSVANKPIVIEVRGVHKKLNIHSTQQTPMKFWANDWKL